MRVEHTLTFVSNFDTEKIPAEILPQFFALSEESLIQLCKEATKASLVQSGALDAINEHANWAIVSVI